MFLKLFKGEYLFGSQVVLIYIFWLFASTCQSIVNKLALNSYPYPLTIALSSLLNTVICTIPLLRLLHIKPVRVNASYIVRTILPISLGRAAAVSASYFGLSKVPISYAQTVKATMPCFTVLVSRIMLNEKQPGKVYASLVPIIFGVFTASVTELQFDSIGLFSSLFSTLIFAFLNVLAKKVFEETGMHPMVLLFMNSQLAAVALFPLWLVNDGYSMLSNFMLDVNTKAEPHPDIQFLIYLFLSGFCSFMQNLCAFALIHQLTTLSYSVANATKKIFVIMLSLIVLQNPVTFLNMLGMSITILGVFAYNRVKSSTKAKYGEVAIQQEQEDNKKLLRHHDHNGAPFDIKNLHSSNSDVRLMLSIN
ncbi:triose-phosphate transporter family domain-containing protein [Ditylenchus destructor]|uniref:Triose-phosphate transporter family domain-containing protein n=1 Tax=Ditylenchus destructor TaxID=166010 RepID=A0AAD4N6A9_9BILA|nr:triose-phosphate transporter family domain-containing protein [Ditylenchus destructor]